jgi:hypothetical protein
MQGFRLQFRRLAPRLAPVGRLEKAARLFVLVRRDVDGLGVARVDDDVVDIDARPVVRAPSIDW